MEYESDILKRLIIAYGVVGNPRYISEIIKEFIVQGKGRFPELFTYQSDWLAHIDKFGLNPSYTVSYTGQSIYAPNTLEKPVKSAILKGNTLVNVVSSYWFSGRKNSFSINLKQYKIGQSYIFIMFDAPSNTTEIYLGDANGSIMWSNYTNNFTRNKNSVMLKVTCPSNYDGSTILPHLRYLNNEVPSSIDNIKCMLIEYQQDMESWYIPYFEGMQSVKMPVLKTSNEDDTKTNILTVNEDVTLRSNGDICDELNLLTGQLTQRIGEDGVVLSQEVVKTVDLTILDQNGQIVEQLMSFNGGTHFNTGSLEGSLLPSVSVSVETDLEETLKVCSIEGNTL